MLIFLILDYIIQFFLNIDRKMRSLLLILIAFSLLLPVGWTDDYRQWDLPEGATMRLGKGSIIEIAYSPDSKYLAVTSTIGIWLYDLQTLKEAKLLTAEENRISTRIFHKIAFSPDGKTLASATSSSSYSSTGHNIWLWDTEKGTIKDKINKSAEISTLPISSIVFSPDGGTIAFTYSGFKEGKIQLWDTQESKYIGNLSNNPKSQNIAFSPNGNTLATIDKNGFSISFWDLNSIRKTEILICGVDMGWKTKTIVMEEKEKVKWFDFVFDTVLVIQDINDTVRYLNIDSLEQTEVKPIGKIMDKSRAFDSTTKFSAIAVNGVIQLRDLQNGELKSLSTNNSTFIRSLTISPDNMHIACVRADGTIYFYDTKTGDTIGKITGHKAGIYWSSLNYQEEYLTFISDGTKLLGGNQIWDLKTGQPIPFKSGKMTSMYPIALSPDETILVNNYNVDILLTYTHSGVPKIILQGHLKRVACAAFSPDGKTLASGSTTHSSEGNRKPVTIRLWNTATGESTMSLSGHTGGVTGLAFSPDGSKLASGSYDNTIRLWHPHTGQQKHQIVGGIGDTKNGQNKNGDNLNGAITCIAFSPDGKIIAAGSGRPRNIYIDNPDTSIRLWDTITGDELMAFKGHLEDVLCIAFSPDGNTLVSGSEDKTIRLWDIQTAQLKTTITGHINPVYAITFSPDGKTLVSSSGNGTIYFWDLTKQR